MCMACNNRLCGACRRRFGEHRRYDDACPSGVAGEFRETQRYTPWPPPKPRPVSKEKETDRHE
jgi:hypothetical protein